MDTPFFVKIRLTVYYFLALLCVAIWGTTFVSTKILILNGLNPEEIILVRYGLAYLCLLPFTRRWKADGWKDELLIVLLSVMGGTIYFMTENSAVKYTLTTNVSLITSTTPLFTALSLPLFFRHVHYTPRLFLGSLLACVGVALIVGNGHYVLKLNPLGDLLALGSALSWTAYSLLFQTLGKRYSTLFLTRKLFFYGVVTTLPIALLRGDAAHLADISWMSAPVVGNLLFLGLVASLGCFHVWGVSVKKIGTITANNFIYFSPLFTLITAFLVLHEPISWLSLLGMAFTILGVYLARVKE